MDINQINLFKMANKQMDYLGKRQEVLAKNVANANTPEYMPEDVKTPDFSETLKKTTSSPLTTTNEAHISGEVNKLVLRQADSQNSEIPNQQEDFKTIKTTPYEMSPDKNGVVLEEQMAKIGETKSDYDKVTQIYKSYLSLIKASIGKS